MINCKFSFELMGTNSVLGRRRVLLQQDVPIRNNSSVALLGKARDRSGADCVQLGGIFMTLWERMTVYEAAQSRHV